MGKKILVIDDEPDIVKILVATLKANQYLVVTAQDGEEGLQKVVLEEPDLIIVDVMMPKMDGFTFVKRLKSREDWRSIPVIVLTAKDKMKELFEVEGVAAYLVKPFDYDELVAAVKKHLPWI